MLLALLGFWCACAHAPAHTALNLPAHIPLHQDERLGWTARGDVGGREALIVLDPLSPFSRTTTGCLQDAAVRGEVTLVDFDGRRRRMSETELTVGLPGALRRTARLVIESYPRCEAVLGRDVLGELALTFEPETGSVTLEGSPSSRPDGLRLARHPESDWLLLDAAIAPADGSASTPWLFIPSVSQRTSSADQPDRLGLALRLDPHMAPLHILRWVKASTVLAPSQGVLAQDVLLQRRIRIVLQGEAVTLVFPAQTATPHPR